MRPALWFTAAFATVAGVGFGLLALRPEPAGLLVREDKEIVGVILGCAKTDRWIRDHESNPSLVIVALNPDEHGGTRLCEAAVQKLPFYWRITPREACVRLVEHARDEAQR